MTHREFALNSSLVQFENSTVTQSRIVQAMLAASIWKGLHWRYVLGSAARRASVMHPCKGVPLCYARKRL
jgi:D-alanyl-lipoteichoic acid acyltransferase DltB (MBOAT superfamily)